MKIKMVHKKAKLKQISPELCPSHLCNLSCTSLCVCVSGEDHISRMSHCGHAPSPLFTKREHKNKKKVVYIFPSELKCVCSPDGLSDQDRKGLPSTTQSWQSEYRPDLNIAVSQKQW